MPIPGIRQPETLAVTEKIRLRRFDGDPDAALSWYQDPETVWMIDGAKEPYSRDRLERMYRYLESRGELYWIEIQDDGVWRKIGDVTFWKDDMPIVIGDAAYRARGIGQAVIAALVSRAKALGYSELRVAEIYDWNAASQRCFAGQGFRMLEKTRWGHSYLLKLQ